MASVEVSRSAGRKKASTLRPPGTPVRVTRRVATALQEREARAKDEVRATSAYTRGEETAVASVVEEVAEANAGPTQEHAEEATEAERKERRAARDEVEETAGRCEEMAANVVGKTATVNANPERGETAPVSDKVDRVNPGPSQGRVGEETETVRCECGVNEDDGEPLLQCEECEVWSHTACAGVTMSEAQNMRFSCQECKTGKTQDGKEEEKLSEEDQKCENGPGEGEMDKRRKQAQDKVVREVLERAEKDGSRSLRSIDEEVKESYAAERKEQGVRDTNTAHSVKGLAIRVRAALTEEGWVKIGDQLVSKGGGEEGVWRMVKAVLETMEGRDRELKLANERIGVLTKRVEELEQERSRNRQWQEGEKGQSGGRGKDEREGALKQKVSSERSRQVWGRQGGQKKVKQRYSEAVTGGQKKGHQSDSKAVTGGQEKEARVMAKERKSRQGKDRQQREGRKNRTVAKESGEGQGGHTKGNGVAPISNRQVEGAGKDPRIGAPIILTRVGRRWWRNQQRETVGGKRLVKGPQKGQVKTRESMTKGNVEGGGAPETPERVGERVSNQT